MPPLGRRNATRDARDLAVMLQRHSLRSTSALDYWDQLVTLHYGGRDGIAAHFREATIAETSFGWAGAPFVTPGTATLDKSILSVTTSDDAFLFQPMDAAATQDKLASVALVSNTLKDVVGIRIDDGTVNNVAEVLLQVGQASPTQWNIYSVNIVGGVTTTATSANILTPAGFVLRMNLVGTRWSAWGFYPVLHTNTGFGGWQYKPQTLMGGGTLAWTPTRAGIFFQPGGQPDLTALVDWFDIGRA